MTVCVRMHDGSVPFHVECLTSALDVVEFLASTWDQAPCERPNNGCLPLHIAARQSSSLGVVKFIARAYPLALQLGAAVSERYPLHRTSPRSLEAAQVLYVEYPQALRIRDANGWLPLPVASQYGPGESLEVVQFFTNEWPDALLEENVPAAPGSLPIHIAAHHAHVSVVRFLARACPRALGRPDQSGRLPMHYGVDRSLRADLAPNE
jgi:hypothetical protein